MNERSPRLGTRCSGHPVVHPVYGTKIHSSLDWWRKNLPRGIGIPLAPWWPSLLTATAMSWLIVMELGIFGYVPGQSDPEVLLNIVFSVLLLTVVPANLAFIAAISKDVVMK